MDRLVDETVTTLHPDSLMTNRATNALRRLMHHYAGQHPATHWAQLVSAPEWRHNRPAIIRGIAEREWLEDSSERTALMCAELQVMAFEALASRWTPDQCRVQAVRIDGQLVTSLVCNLEGFAA